MYAKWQAIGLHANLGVHVRSPPRTCSHKLKGVPATIRMPQRCGGPGTSSQPRLARSQTGAALREKGLRTRFAQAFSRGSMQPSTRRAYVPGMSESYGLDTMKAMGFAEAKPQAAYGAAWSEEEVNAMLQCLADLHAGDDAIHTQDPPSTSWPTTPLLRQKAPAQVKRLLQFIDERYGS